MAKKKLRKQDKIDGKGISSHQEFKKLTSKTQTTMETKSIKLNYVQALTILHMIEHETKNVLRDRNYSAEYKDYTLKELRELHDTITNIFKDLY